MLKPYLALVESQSTTFDGYNIQSRDRLAEYIYVRWVQLFFHLVCRSSSIREGRYITPNAILT